MATGNSLEDVLILLVKEIETFVGSFIDFGRRAEFLQPIFTHRGVVKGGDVFQIPVITSSQNIHQGFERIDGLFDGGDLGGFRAIPMIYASVVIKLSGIVGGGFYT